VQHTKGVGADLSHIETKCKVSAFVGQDQLHDSLVGADIVVIPGKYFFFRIIKFKKLKNY
jgi:malate dehydrogenase